jgi:hypothetical protein
MAHDGDPQMKPISALSDDDLERWLRRAAAMPDAPSSWVRRAATAFAAARAEADGRGVSGMMQRIAAVLSFDSWAQPALAAGMRAAPSDTRHLLFSSQGRDIDLRITASASEFALTGQILGPDESGVVELSPETDGDAPMPRVRSTALDALGEFRLDGVQRGTYRLTLRVGGDLIALPPIAVGERPS